MKVMSGTMVSSNPNTIGKIDMPANADSTEPSKTPQIVPQQDIQLPGFQMIIKPVDASTQSQQIVINKTNQYVINKELKSIIFSFYQGNESEFQNEILDWFIEEKPNIIFNTTWTVGIATYLFLIYTGD